MVDFDLQFALTVVAVIVPLVMVFIVPRNRSPTSAIAWLLLIALIPVLGLIIYFILGSPKLPRKRRRRQRQMDALIAQGFEDARSRPEVEPFLAPSLPPHVAPIATLAYHLGRMPALAGNAIEILGHYGDAVAKITRAIEEARTYVHLEYYILVLDDATEPLLRALENAAARGVKVRVLFDHVGSRSFPRHRELLARFTAAGIVWQRSLPLLPIGGRWARPDLRNHRKIVVVDGATAFIGSQNIIRRGYTSDVLKFREVVCRIRGPAALSLDAVFATDWHGESGEIIDDRDPEDARPLPAEGNVVCQVLPSGSGHSYANNLRVFLTLLYGARSRIVLVNPYFVPSEPLLMAITSAVQRGVDVRLITNEVGDNRFLSYAQASYYAALMDAGVKVFLHPHPTVLHSKTITIDDGIAVLGSSNLDIRSLYLNLEVSLLCYDEGVVRSVRALETDYEQASALLDRAAWRARPLSRRIVEDLARLTSSLQ